MRQLGIERDPASKKPKPAIRLQVAGMDSPEELLQVVREIQKQLDELEVKPDAT